MCNITPTLWQWVLSRSPTFLWLWTHAFSFNLCISKPNQMELALPAHSVPSLLHKCFLAVVYLEQAIVSRNCFKELHLPLIEHICFVDSYGCMNRFSQGTNQWLFWKVSFARTEICKCWKGFRASGMKKREQRDRCHGCLFFKHIRQAPPAHQLFLCS